MLTCMNTNTFINDYTNKSTRTNYSNQKIKLSLLTPKTDIKAFLII